MVINYKKTQKTILRVNPTVPLAEHLAAICEKCEFDAESTVLLKDVHSLAPLDLSCSLNDYAIRELYARDTGSTYPNPAVVAALRRWEGDKVLEMLVLALFVTVVALLQNNPPLRSVPSHRALQVLEPTNLPLYIFDVGLSNAVFLMCFPGNVVPGKDKTQKEEENKGLFSKFRKSKKKEQVMLRHGADEE